MTNPTDTNQASGDELRTLDEILSQAFTDGASDTMWIADRHVEIFATAKEELLNLIRTEKLKLLTEVRERVVGEDYDIPAEMEKVGRDFQKLDAIAKTGGLLNKFKADLRTKLTKLEAEL